MTRRTSPSRVALVAFASIVSLAGVACGGDNADDGSEASGRTIHVPADEATIAAAVERAKPGDLVLIAPGTYREAVHITTDSVVIRGENRHTVILDGGHKLGNGFRIEANGVTIENLTVHSYTQNGVLFNGAVEDDGTVSPNIDYGLGENTLVGYRASWITAYNNGLYGIYAFAARDGRIEHSTVSGHPDSGLYVGQCQPCNVVIDDVTATHNAIGYYGTNASGGVYIVNSTFASNRLGLTPNSQQMEKLSPQAETVIAANRVIDNDDPNTPVIPKGFFGGGIAIGGGNRNIVTKNLVTGHSAFGIGILGVAEFAAENNTVEANSVSDNVFDLYYAALAEKNATLGNCFRNNTFATSFPAQIETVMPCGQPSTPLTEQTPPLPIAPPGVDYRTIPAPTPDGAQMPDPSNAPAAPAINVFVPIDVSTLTSPNAG